MTLEIRRATASDVAAIVALLADDPLGSTRERPGDPRYSAAFEQIDNDPQQLLVVGEQAGEIVATAQLTFTPGLTHLGATRATIEAVRVRPDHRSAGIGQQLIEWAIEESRSRGCDLVQLTSNVSRTDAHRFYRRLGFEASHVGMKRAL